MQHVSAFIAIVRYYKPNNTLRNFTATVGSITERERERERERETSLFVLK